MEFELEAADEIDPQMEVSWITRRARHDKGRRDGR